MKALVYVLPVALAIYALIDLSRSTPEERSGLRVAAWVAIIVLLPVLGPIGWVLVSRLNRSQSGPAGRPARPSGPPARPWTPRRSGPPAPDDDPDFLWRIEQEQRRRNRGTTPPAADPPASGTDPGGTSGQGTTGRDADGHGPDKDA